MQHPPPVVFDSFHMLELLLCGNPAGNAKHEGLKKATTSSDVNLVRLFLKYGADINFNGAAALGYAIKDNQVDIVTILLEKQKLTPELASDLVAQIPARCPSADRLQFLSKLVSCGATGLPCSMLLIKAVEQNDMETARLLVTSKDPGGMPISSVDYNGGKCMVISIMRETRLSGTLSV
jgi:hypothetical protein